MGKWEMVRLGDVCQIQSGGTPSRAVSEYWTPGVGGERIPWVKISDIKQKYVADTEEHIANAGLESSSAKLFPAGTILYTIFATLGEVAVLSIDAATNQAIVGITVPEQINANFLYYYLKSIKNQVMNKGRGVAQNNINLSILRDFQIPLPPLSIQQKIAETLDKASELIDNRKRQIEKLDLLVKSKFVEMFGDPVLNPMGWEVCSLSEHLKVIGGYAFSSEKFVESGIPILRIGNINSGFFKPTNLVYWEYESKLDRYLMYPGDLVISLTGTVGKDDYANVCILGEEYERYYLNQRNAKLELKNTIDKTYLANVLKVPQIKSKLTGISRGVRQANVSNNDILNLSVQLPPLSLQQQFAEFVRAVEQTKAEMRRGLEKQELLYKSLMQKCFNGEVF